MAFDRAYLYLTAADSNGSMAGKYKRLSFTYSETPGGTDETGCAIGPTRTVTITAKGYWGDFPSKHSHIGLCTYENADNRHVLPSKAL